MVRTATPAATKATKEKPPHHHHHPSSSFLHESSGLDSPYHAGTEKDASTQHLLSSSASLLDESLNTASDDYDMAVITRRSWLFSILITIFGVAMAVAFAWYGVEDSSTQAKDRFHRRATELNRLIQSTWSDYEVTALTTHDFCRKKHNLTSRQDFRAYYQYVVAGGIEVQSLQCAWNVTHEERPAIEAAARSYVLQEYNYTAYQGFLGLVPNGEGGLMAVPREEHSYYVIIYYMEPFLGNAGAYTLDLATDQVEGAAKLEYAWRTRKPTLSGRLSTIQETEASAYSVIIYHPGIPLPPSLNDPDERPTFTSLLVRIPSLLDRVARLQEENLAIYIYTVEDTGDRIFLGAASYQVLDEGNTGTTTTKVEYMDEIDFDQLMRRHDANNDKNKKMRYERVPIASGSWDLVVLPMDDTYQPDLRFVYFGSAMIVLATFGLAIWMYTNSRKILQIHKAKIQAEAERTIVSGLFPETIRERLLQGAQAQNQLRRQSLKKSATTAGTTNCSTVTAPGSAGSAGAAHHGNNDPQRLGAAVVLGAEKNKSMTSQRIFGTRPIAEFHPAVSILCADLVGFSAWSSMREPSQVISFLEILFYDFDQVAQRRDIFKVETVGDCYVAACGLLKERKDHAIAIAKFAVECRNHMNSLVNELETTFGPETGDLSIRIGIHSGPVTGGVLRGDKGRFQLFGATVNTANQMESTGEPGQIHVSPETADLFKASGKDYWLLPRPEKIFIRGRGPLQTYWLRNYSKTASSGPTSFLRTNSSQEVGGGGGGLGPSGHHDDDNDRIQRAKADRLVRWNVEQLSKLLSQIVARRQGSGNNKSNNTRSIRRLQVPMRLTTRTKSGGELTPLDEVMEMVFLPKFDACPMPDDGAPTKIDVKDVVLPIKVVEQLTELVTCIGNMYKNENAFHNFEHASHVAMSVTKLLAQIAHHHQPNDNNGDRDGGNNNDKSEALGFGITSDPLTHFAAFFSAMIHDVDHPGIPNTFLMDEKPQLAEKYKYKSVAEQHSFDLAWSLFMKDEFLDLRQYLFPPSNNKNNSFNELKRFRQLVLTMVMATDLLDKELGMLRQERFKKAFAKRKVEGGGESKRTTSTDDSSSSTDRDRKAMIVIEYLLQCADISHTMQHWHVYRKWNENLFMELYDAYKHNRIDQDPSKSWYEGEIGFFDYFVLPLAKNLDKCGVFGVSGDEFRLYAIENRKEWERKGKQLVSEYLLKYDEYYQQMHPEIAQDMVSYAHTGIIFEENDHEEDDDDDPFGDE